MGSFLERRIPQFIPNVTGANSCSGWEAFPEKLPVRIRELTS
jgi:hypothetical protein